MISQVHSISSSNLSFFSLSLLMQTVNFFNYFQRVSNKSKVVIMFYVNDAKLIPVLYEPLRV